MISLATNFGYILLLYFKVFLLLDYREAFANYDKNGDGTIDENELMYVMRSLGENPSEDQMAYIMHEVSKLYIDRKWSARKRFFLFFFFASSLM